MSRKSGLEIANSHVSRIENGESTNVSVEKLRALAKGLDVSEGEVFAAARGGLTRTELVNEEHARLVEMYSDIPAQCQKDVMDLLAVLQKNHSLSQRRARLVEHREEVVRRREAASAESPPPATTPEEQPPLFGNAVRKSKVKRKAYGAEPEAEPDAEKMPRAS